jgi:hypothetical protein
MEVEYAIPDDLVYLDDDMDENRYIGLHLMIRSVEPEEGQGNEDEEGVSHLEKGRITGRG